MSVTLPCPLLHPIERRLESPASIYWGRIASKIFYSRPAPRKVSDSGRRGTDAPDATSKIALYVTREYCKVSISQQYNYRYIRGRPLSFRTGQSVVSCAMK